MKPFQVFMSDFSGSTDFLTPNRVTSVQNLQAVRIRSAIPCVTKSLLELTARKTMVGVNDFEISHLSHSDNQTLFS